MKYLIEIHHGIGDVVQMTGVIETIYKYDSKSQIDLILLSEDRASLLKDDYRVKTIYIINIANNSKRYLLSTVKKMRKQKYDYLFFSPISNTRDANILAMLINPKRIVGEQFHLLSYFFNKFIYVKKEDCHIVKRNSNLLIASGITDKVYFPKLIIKDVFKEKDNTIGICIGTSKPQKNWAVERYIEVAKFVTTIGYDVVFIGGKAESDLVPSDLFEKNKNWLNYMGKLSLTESASLVKSCKLIIGGDTGIMHIAAALNIKTIAIFSCSSPYYHAPYSECSYFLTANIPCQYCYGTKELLCCKEYKCLDGISVNQVCKLIRDVFSGNTNSKYIFRI